MTPLPAPFGDRDAAGWRLDTRRHAADWDSGEGARRNGGRWNSKGVAAVYASLDPATAILEVAVHKTFQVLDAVPHVLTRLRLTDASAVRVVQPADVPNAGWLSPGVPGAGQQAFGDELLRSCGMFLIPSSVSGHSWNLVFDPAASALYQFQEQEPFALDTRLNPPGR